MMGQAIADNVIQAIRPQVRGRTVCLVCHEVVGEHEQHVRLRGSGYVHRRCATYEMRARRIGAARLGTPRGYATGNLMADRARRTVPTGD